MSRLTFAGRDSAALVFLMLGLQAGAAAQSSPDRDTDYPAKPIRILVGVPPGGSTDLVSRIVANEFLKTFGQPVIVDNRPGAGHAVASAIVAKSAPNGYTLQMVNANHTQNPFIVDNLPYDAQRDFTPITQVVTQPLVLVVNASLPVASVKELIAMAKAKPGTLSAGTAGTAGAGALTTLMFKQQTGTDFVTVPYKGGGPALTGLLSGEVQFYFSSMTSSWGAIKNGKVKVLGTSSKTRLPAMPEVPTLLESGLVGLDLAPWDGLVAPAKTPRAIVDRLYREVSRLLKLPDVLAKLSAAGSYPIGNTPDEFAAEIKHQLDVVGRVFKAEKIKRE